MKKKIFVMSKVPFRGIIKTRLSKEIGFTKSKRLTINNLEKIKKIFLSKKSEYFLYWYLTPFHKFRTFSFSISKFCLPQSKGNLGEKMWNLASKNSSPFLIIGSDIPNINLNSISYAFKKLKTNDIVLGPTYDGGFWLIGFSCKRKIIFPFKNVKWSSKNTLTDLTTNLKYYSIKHAFTKKLRDIDNKADYCQNIKD